MGTCCFDGATAGASAAGVSVLAVGVVYYSGHLQFPTRFKSQNRVQDLKNKVLELQDLGQIEEEWMDPVLLRVPNGGEIWSE